MFQIVISFNLFNLLPVIQMGCTIDGCLKPDYLKHSKQQRYLDRINQLPINEINAIQFVSANRQNHVQLYQKGYRFLLQQNIQQASLFFKTAIASDDNFNYQIDGIGSIEDQVGYYEHNPVDWFFQKSVKKTPYDALSLCFLINQRYDEAETWYKLIIQEKPKFYQLILGLGHSYLNRKQYSKAKQHYIKVVQLAPRFDKPYQLIAFICKIHQSSNGQAVKWAQKCLIINPQNFYASFMLAICEQNLKKKIQKLKIVIKKNQKYGRAYNSLGNALKKLKNYEQARKHYGKCIQISPSYDAPYLGIGNIYRQKQMFQQSVIWYQKSIFMNPSADKSYNALGNAYYEMKQYDKSMQVYLKCIEINPQFSPAYYGIGIAYKQKSMMEQSIQWLKKSSNINSSYEISYITIGNVYVQLKQYDQAIQIFHKQILINKESRQIYLSLANVYNLKEQYDKSLQFYNKALEIDQNYVEAFYGIASVYKTNQQLQKAVQYYQKCIAINQKFQAAYYQLGKLYKNRKQYHKAQKWYQQYLTINPKSHHALKCIGNIESEKGNYNLAIQSYLKSIQCNPTYGPSYYGLGRAYYILNQYQKSQQFYRKCIQINPKNEHPFNGLGNICTSLKKYDEAVELYNKSIEINPQNDASYYGLGNVYSDQQCLPQAIFWYQKCLQKNINNPLCLTNLGCIYLKIQNFRQAFSHFSKAKDTIFLDDRLTSKNQEYLKEHLVKFWQTMCLTGFISEQDKQNLGNTIKNFESKIKYLYQTSSNKNFINRSIGLNINTDFTRIISLIFQDKFKLTKIQQIFNTVHILFRSDQSYFHIIPQLFCQYFWNEKFIVKKQIIEIEQSLSLIIQKESEIYVNAKQEKNNNNQIVTKDIIKLTISQQKKEINLFKDTVFFPSYQQLYMEIKKVNQKAFQSLQEFSYLVYQAKKSGHGFQEAISKKIPQQANKQFKVMIRIMQKMFKQIKNRKNDIISKLDKTINSGTVINLQSVVHEIVKIWTDQIDIILTNRMKKKVPTQCFISDLIRGKCYFHNIKDIQAAIVKIEEVCLKKGYIILQFQNRLSKLQTKDVVLKIAIREAVCQLQLALNQNTKQYHFIHCIYEISRSPLGCIFGSFLFLAKEIKYHFVQRCKDLAEKLEGKSSLKHRVLVKKIQYILDIIEDQHKSRLK